FSNFSIVFCHQARYSITYSGDILPTKERLERPVATQKTDTGLTPGLLKVLNKQILSNPQNDTRPPLSYLPIPETISMEELQQKWKGLCQPSEQLDTAGPGELLRQHPLDAVIRSIFNALRYACEILTEYEGGGAATMPFHLFAGLYTYLAHLGGEIPRTR
ncbi:ropporin-1-like protein, partial [Salvelinus alpinus]